MNRKHYGRILAGVLATVLMVQGAASLYRGDLGWKNYWGGGFVFAPVTIVIALLVFVVVFKKPSSRRRIRDRSGFSWTK